MVRRLLSLLLSATISISSVFSLLSCSATITPPEEEPGGGVQAPAPPASGKEDDTLIVPEAKPYPDRRTVNFDEITYARPDMAAITASFEGVAQAITDGAATFDDIIASIESLEDEYESVFTMLSYANIMMSKDTGDEFWCGEYAYVSENYPTFAAALEDMFVAAACSPDATRYEDEYFGEGLIENYADGGDLTDALVALLAEEARLENAYSSLSSASVVITYNNMTATCDEILAFYEENYGTLSQSYKLAEEACEELYAKECSRLSCEYYTELVKVRRNIADEYGYTSYSIVAYDELYHDYTEEEMLAYLYDIAEYAVPVYSTLYSYVFYNYFASHDAAKLGAVPLMNDLYGVTAEMDEGLFDAYSYMLQFGLYDVSVQTDNRFGGSFTTYMDGYDAPFVFVTLDGACTDYHTLAHEFGHFYDSFVNGGNGTSLDLSEVSSTALELLVSLRLRETLDDGTAKYLHYSQVYNALSTFVFQGFYALFEHYVYSIPEDQISTESITSAMHRAASDIGLNAAALVPNPEHGIYSALDYVLITHVMEYPFYVESYCTSAAVALEIYFKEAESEGEGVRTYIELVDRADPTLSFEEYLASAGLASPFSDGYMMTIAYKLYAEILGEYRFESEASTPRLSRHG